MSTLNFTDEQMVILNEALIELPYKKAAPIIAEINKQLNDKKENEE